MSQNQQLQLRWRNPHLTPPAEQWTQRTQPWTGENGEIDPFQLRTLEQVIEAYNLTFPARQRDLWRWTFPNVGYLRSFPEFPTAVPLATNGILAHFWVDHSGHLFLGHLANFVGPIAKEYVDEEDWDWQQNRRKVRVFKRKDGSLVIIPQDTFWERYWSKHKQLTREHHQILEQVVTFQDGKLVRGTLSASKIDEEFAKLDNPTPSYKPKAKTRRQILIDSI